MLNNQKAFTLIELMVAIGILGIVLVIGIPAYNQTMINNRSVSTADEFADALKYVRSEAMRTSNTVTLCPLDNKGNADDSDDVCGTDWQKGWIAVKDTATTVTGDPVVANESAILRRWPVVNTKINYTFTPSRNFIRFAALGVLGRDKGASEAVIKVYFAKCKGSSAKKITVGLSGMTRVDTTACPAS